MLRKTLAAVFVLVLMCSAAAAFQSGDTWTTFDSPEGRFSILTPSKPTVEVKEIDSAVGKLTLYAYSLSNETGYFMISFGDYPREPTDAAQTLKVLEGVRSGVVKGLQGELTSDESVAFDGYPGREFKAKRVVENSEVIFRWKIVLVGRRLYQVAAATTTGQAESPQLAKFFSSFQLKK